jgi:hypothetical protein
LRTEIKDLRDRFLRIAELHPWISLAIPAEGPIHAGEQFWLSERPPDPPGRILDQFGRPQTSPRPTVEERAAYRINTGAVRFFDNEGRRREPSIEEVVRLLREEDRLPDRLFELYGPPPWVRVPEDPQRRPVVGEVNALTSKANRLLFRVLDGPNQVPADFQEQIREWDRRCLEYGWICWLRHYVVIHGPHRRFDNYPHVAATGLWELREVAAPPTNRDGKPAEPPGSIPAVDEEDVRILRALEKRAPVLLTQDEIEAESRVSRRTISNRIPRLLSEGLVVQPKGTKSGTTISHSGRQLLNRIDGANPAQ